MHKNLASAVLIWDTINCLFVNINIKLVVPPPMVHLLFFIYFLRLDDTSIQNIPSS